MTKINTKKLRIAEQRVQEAREALKKVELEAKEAEGEVLARRAEASIKEANRAVWEVLHLHGFEGKFKPVYDLFEAAQEEFCAVAFGARERMLKLNALDPDRWTLEGEFKPSVSGMTTDDDMAYSIATWLFDCGVEKNPSHPSYTEALEKATKAVGFGIAGSGFAHYLEGNHDT